MADLFGDVNLSGALEQSLRRMNPWWEGKPGPETPPHRRHLVAQIRRRLAHRLAPIVVVRGARQVGKTTSQLHVLDDLLAAGTPGTHVFRAQFDDLAGLKDLEDPILRLVDWYEAKILRKTLNTAAHDGEPTYLFFDEVQNPSNWAPQLKALVDSTTTHVVVTGSSALRIEQGRDSLAGRITTIETGVLSLTEIAQLRGIDLGRPFLDDNGLGTLKDVAFWRELAACGRNRSRPRDQAFRCFSERGGYPLGHARADIPWPELADQLNETVVRRVIQHDLRVGERGRKRDPALLEELFRLVCRYAGQAPAIHTLGDEVRRALAANLGDARVRTYLRFLSETLLVRAIEPLEIRLERKRGSPKLCLVDHALRASWLQEFIPLDAVALREKPDLGVIAGHLAESTVGATFSTIAGLDVSHLPARDKEREVDFVLTIGTQRIPVEVKYRSQPDPCDDTAGLRAFIAKDVNHAPFGILLTREDTDLALADCIVAMPVSTLMLLR